MVLNQSPWELHLGQPRSAVLECREQSPQCEAAPGSTAQGLSDSGSPSFDFTLPVGPCTLGL